MAEPTFSGENLACRAFEGYTTCILTFHQYLHYHFLTLSLRFWRAETITNALTGSATTPPFSITVITVVAIVVVVFAIIIVSDF